MTWKVLEQCVVPVMKAGRGPEDAIFKTGTADEARAYVITDGYSTHQRTPIDGLTPGQFVVREAGKAFQNLRVPVCRKDISLWFNAVSEYVGGVLKREGRFDERDGLYRRPGLVCVAFLPHLQVVARVGDCQVFFNGAGHNPGLAVDAVKADLRWMRMLELLGECDPSQPSARRDALVREDPTQVLMRSLNADWQQAFRNKTGPYGYGVVDGTAIPEEHIEVFDVGREVRQVTLTSDGIPRMFVLNSLEETQRAFLAELQRDPLCINLLRGVRGAVVGTNGEYFPYDDFSYVSFQNPEI